MGSGLEVRRGSQGETGDTGPRTGEGMEGPCIAMLSFGLIFGFALAGYGLR